MSLTTTVGHADSDSFASLAEIDTFLGEFYGAVPTVWSSLTTTQQEYVARTMSGLIGYYPLRGRKVYLNQALAFPRDCQTDTTIVPEAVKEVQALLCLRVGIYVLNRLLEESTDDAALPATAGAIKDVTIGPLTFGLGGDDESVPSTVEALLTRSRFADLRLRLKPYLAAVRGRLLRTETEIDEDEDDMEEVE